MTWKKHLQETFWATVCSGKFSFKIFSKKLPHQIHQKNCEVFYLEDKNPDVILKIASFKRCVPAITIQIQIWEEKKNNKKDRDHVLQHSKTKPVDKIWSKHSNCNSGSKSSSDIYSNRSYQLKPVAISHADFCYYERWR